MVLTALAGIADFERSLIVERTSARRVAAKAHGVRFGPTSTHDAGRIRARQLIEKDGKPVEEVARWLGVHRATLYRGSSSMTRKHRADKRPATLVPAGVRFFRILRRSQIENCRGVLGGLAKADLLKRQAKQLHKKSRILLVDNCEYRQPRSKRPGR